MGAPLGKRLIGESIVEGLYIFEHSTGHGIVHRILAMPRHYGLKDPITNTIGHKQG